MPRYNLPWYCKGWGWWQSAHAHMASGRRFYHNGYGPICIHCNAVMEERACSIYDRRDDTPYDRWRLVPDYDEWRAE